MKNRKIEQVEKLFRVCSASKSIDELFIAATDAKKYADDLVDLVKYYKTNENDENFHKNLIYHERSFRHNNLYVFYESIDQLVEYNIDTMKQEPKPALKQFLENNKDYEYITSCLSCADINDDAFKFPINVLRLKTAYPISSDFTNKFRKRDIEKYAEQLCEYS
tara:strand:- start:54 stop:545 length:492 start_codon:yes stop_codon:yes gene_type:complete